MWWLFLCLMGCQVFYTTDGEQTTVQVYNTSSYNKGIDNSIKSSVKINCHIDGIFLSKGSGNYLKSGKHKFVLTAAHVVNRCDEVHLIDKYGSTVLGEVVWTDEEKDVSIVKPNNELGEVEAVHVDLKDKKYLVGGKVYFMGHPDELNFFLFEGLISLNGEEDFFLHSTGWGGVSGAVVFSKRGKVLGVAKAVKVTINPITGFPRLLEDLVLVSKTDFLTKEILRESMGDE